MILALSAVALLYALVLFWLAAGLQKPRPAPTPDSSAAPFVSVIVAARNEAENLPSLFATLKGQSYPGDGFEILVADDHSTDGTAEVASKEAREDSRVAFLPAEPPHEGWAPKKWVLDRAVHRARGELLLFTDADCRPAPRWIETMAAPFRDLTVGLATGPSPLNGGAGLWNRMLLADSIGQDALAAGGMGRGLPLTCSGRNLAVRASAFHTVGGYNDVRHLASGDDDLLMHKITSGGFRAQFVLDAGAEVVSLPPKTVRDFLFQRLRFASKGLTYYTMPRVSRRFLAFLPIIYLANLSAVVGMALSIASAEGKWLLPWFAKMAGDAALLARYSALTGRQILPATFLIDELWHGAYVSLLGVLGPLVPVRWKGREGNAATR